MKSKPNFISECWSLNMKWTADKRKAESVFTLQTSLFMFCQWVKFEGEIVRSYLEQPHEQTSEKSNQLRKRMKMILHDAQLEQVGAEFFLEKQIATNIV